MSTDVAPKRSFNVLGAIGWVLTVLPAAMLMMSAYFKLTRPPMVVEGFTKMGYSPDIIIPLGIVELVCTLLYLFPKTAVLGAILLTGYLGGAINTHVRVNEDFTMPVVIAVVMWLGIYLRCSRLRSVLPLR